MGTAVLGAVVGTTFKVVLDALLEQPIEEIKLVFSFETELDRLENSLRMVQAFVSDAEEIQLQKSAVKLWLERLEDVAFEADAVLDELNYELLRQKAEGEDRVLNKVSCCFGSSSSCDFLFRRKMVLKIDSVNKSLEKINKEAKGFGLQTVVANASHSSSVGLVLPLELQTHSNFVEPDFVGREKDVSKIVEMLVNAPFESKVSVIPVVGMGGIGKTTLVREVFHHEKIQSHFEEKVWVCVSVHFSAVALFKMILEKTSGENVQLLVSMETVLEKVRVQFASKKYVLVLDDVWNDDSGKWEEFIISLSRISSDSGNCIVVTTRSSSVASLVHMQPAYQLGSLSDDNCWSIVKSKALLRAAFPNEFEELGRRIARKCHGLPLAAKVIGGMLDGKPKDEWSFILDNQLSHVGQDENTIKAILKLSYDRLPTSSLKKCFAYCSIFPQDYWIQREHLVELWMAEGFVQADRAIDMETVGNTCFNYLLQNSLLEEVRRDEYGIVSLCKMHDLVHDLASAVSGSRSLSMKDSGSTSTKQQVRYLALDSATDDAFAVSKNQSKCLRTLFLSEDIGHNVFLGFKRLHVLNIMVKEIRVLPSAIEKLIHLRLLDISESQIKFLPDSICRLYNLQTLRSISQMCRSYLENLPDKITNLTSLRHLHIPCMQLPPGVGKLVCLRTLRYFKIGDEKGCGIGELQNLKNLKGELVIRNLERVKDKEEARQANLFGKTKIIKLVLKWDEKRLGEVNDTDVLEGLERVNDMDVLEGLEPHPNLKSLEIIGYEGRKFPMWTMEMTIRNGTGGRREALNDLVTVKLQNCYECEEIPMLGHLPRLKCLELRNMSKLKQLERSFYGVVHGSTSRTNTDVPFPALKEITLSSMPNLIEWVDVEGDYAAFPCLVKIKIKSCPKLKKIPNCFTHLEVFDVDMVDADFSLTDVCSKTTSLQVLRVSSLSGLASLPDDLFTKNQRMAELSISSCSNLVCVVTSFNGGAAFLNKFVVEDCEMLRELPHGVETLPLLDFVQIIRCPQLKTIHTSQLGLVPLQHLEICGCRELTSFPYELLESCTSSLMYLCLSGLTNISRTAPAAPSQLRMLRLRYLHVYKIRKLRNLHIEIPIETSCLRTLRFLSLGGFSESLDLESFNNFLGCIARECGGSLEDLHLYGQENWDCLPDQIQQFTAVLEFWLEDFRIEALPDWFGNLSSMKRLCIINCGMLKHMPSKEAMERLTELEYLDAGECPLLEERCSQEHTAATDDSELIKISRIRVVNFNGYNLSYGRYC